MNPALQYAENHLGVHKVHEEAEALLAELDEAMNALDSATDARRSLDESISNYEMDLLIEERGKHPDHSEAAFQRHLKEVQHKDQTLQQMRSKRNAKAGEATGLELDIEHLKYRLKTKNARMHELGGYFQFLAAVKNADRDRALGQFVLDQAQYAEASTSQQATGGETAVTNTTGETSE